MGFKTADEAAINAEIENLKREIDPPLLRRFEKIAGKYDRPLVPVRKGVCYGCFVRFPTARLAEIAENQPATCDNCGRLLYRIT